ncbi:hypothetical protein ONE63_007664 [Megalurothrips usitatus]|uniref:Uncharacterized protein n=1 Tax=Megalurothrips usitatus TaxID=439358 RepID=A0AAV7XPG8_9NEOP|nr:hypothetical protein ONE63_007664 [Megalurothrips usitatus]
MDPRVKLTSGHSWLCFDLHAQMVMIKWSSRTFLTFETSEASKVLHLCSPFCGPALVEPLMAIKQNKWTSRLHSFIGNGYLVLHLHPDFKSQALQGANHDPIDKMVVTPEWFS